MQAMSYPRPVSLVLLASLYPAADVPGKPGKQHEQDKTDESMLTHNFEIDTVGIS